MIQKTRQQGITSRNIKSACRAIGLTPYKLAIVFQKLSVYENGTLACNKGNTGATSNTPIQT